MIRLELDFADIGGTCYQEECNGQTYNPKNVTGFLPDQLLLRSAFDDLIRKF